MGRTIVTSNVNTGPFAVFFESKALTLQNHNNNKNNDGQKKN